MSLTRPLPANQDEDAAASQPEDVIDQYWERAYRFASMITRNDQDSADVAHEAILVVLKRLDSYDPARGPFEPWLWRIVLNVARDAGRASLRRHSLFDRLAGEQSTSTASDVELIAIRRLSDRELLGAVRGLKPYPRTLIALRFGAQLSYVEIGVQVGVTEAAAKMATHRALTKLRNHLQEGDSHVSQL